MKRSDRHTWAILGCGNFIFDILDAISARGENISRIILNQSIDPSLEKKLPCKPILLEHFVPKKYEHYIFGFIDPDKQRYIEQLARHNLCFTNLVHPMAYLASGVKLGSGNFIGARTVVGPNSTIGDYNYLNRGVLLGHDVLFQDNNHIGPGAIVCGRVCIGSRNQIGAGAIVNDGICIRDSVIVGSGAVVTRDIVKRGTYVGVPAVFHSTKKPHG